MGSCHGEAESWSVGGSSVTGDLFPSMALPGQGRRKGAGFKLPRSVGPGHSRSIPGKGCPDVLPPGQGNDAGLREAPRLYKMGQRPCIPGRQWLCQEVHKDGVGCGLAEDEGSQGDQEDSITDQCPPAAGQKERRLVSQPTCDSAHFSIYIN